MILRRLLLAALLASMAGTALAGRQCELREIEPEKSRLSMQLGDLTRAALGTIDDDVVLIARVGQDLEKYGLTYSHMGFAVREHPAGAWSVVHKLNRCGSTESALYDEGLVNFFADAPHRYQAGIWRLAPAAQRRLKTALLGEEARTFHQPHYNVVAYPFDTRYQNSNGWVLEMLAFAYAGEGEAPDRSGAQAWLKAHAYVPTQVEANILTRFGARFVNAQIVFDDLPPALLRAGHIQVVTVESVIAWLRSLPDACQAAGCPETRLVLPPST